MLSTKYWQQTVWILLIIITHAYKISSNNLPQRAFLTSYKLQKRKIKLVVPLCELPVENAKHPNFEWRRRGVDCFGLKFTFLSTMSLQFCCWLTYDYTGLKKKVLFISPWQVDFPAGQATFKAHFFACTRIWAKVQVRHLLTKSLTKAPYIHTN